MCEAEKFDPAPKSAKACFCEQKKTPILTRAGAENSSLTCNGAVFFGTVGEGVKGTKAAFASLVDKKYVVKNFTGGAEIKCQAGFLGEKDWETKESKECFCDSSVFYSGSRVKIDMEKFRAQEVVSKLETQLTAQKDLQEKVITERNAQAKEAAQMEKKNSKLRSEWQSKYEKEQKDAYET
jgi:hypothetical protein